MTAAFLSILAEFLVELAGDPNGLGPFRWEMTTDQAREAARPMKIACSKEHAVYDICRGKREPDGSPGVDYPSEILLTFQTGRLVQVTQITSERDPGSILIDFHLLYGEPTASIVIPKSWGIGSGRQLGWVKRRTVIVLSVMFSSAGVGSVVATATSRPFYLASNGIPTGSKKSPPD